MLIRGGQINTEKDIVLSMLQNIAIISNDKNTLERVGKAGGSAFQDDARVIQDAMSTRKLTSIQKYDALATSMVDLLYRGRNMLNENTLKELKEQNVVTDADLKKIALFTDMVLKTHDHKLMNYGIISNKEQENFIKKTNREFDSFMPDPKVIKKEQNNMLSESGIKLEVQELKVAQVRMNKIANDAKKQNIKAEPKGEFRKRNETGGGITKNEKEKRESQSSYFQNIDMNKFNKKYGITQPSRATELRSKDAKERIENMYRPGGKPRFGK